MNDNPNGDDSNNNIEEIQIEQTSLMQTEESLKIIQKLYDGLNPLIDEPLPEHSFYLDSDIKRALEVALVALERLHKYELRQSKLPSNACKPWTDEEDNELINGFDNGDDITTLAKHHARTKGAIQARLVKLGKIEL